jgi:secreted trypsin-like serine protease
MDSKTILLTAMLVSSGLVQAEENFSCVDADTGDRVARIVGGTVATPDVSGWQVSLQIDGGHFCGGSLIDPEGYWVLTAAHCIISDIGSDQPGAHFKVEHRSRVLGTGTKQEVERIVVHPDWAHDVRNGNDIALLRLKAPLSANPTIEDGMPYRNVALRATPEGRDAAKLRGDVCAVVTGWGSTEPVRAAQRHRSGEHTAPSRLRKVDVPLVSREVCTAAYGSLAPDQICAGYPQGGKDSCQGDSGGPLVVKSGGQYRQQGVVSWGVGCAAANAYGVYTDVAYHKDWIDRTMAR